MDTLTCICNVTADQHYGKDHPFIEKSAAYEPSTWHRAARYADKGLNPATQLYITVEDRLRVQVINALAGVEVDITARIQLPDGQVIPMRQQLFPTANRALNTFDFDLCEGFLLDLTASTPSAAARVGACFVVVGIIRGNGSNAVPSRTLMSNYLNSGSFIGWPEGPNQQSVQGSGLVRSVLVGNPAAGSDWSVAVPTGARWLVQSLRAVLTSSAAVANRVASLVIADAGGNIVWKTVTAGAQAASQVVGYNFCGGIQTGFTANENFNPIPDVASYLQGFTISTVTALIQAADQWSNITLSLVEWLEL